MEPPFFIQWHITNRCNLRCRHCYQDDFSQAHELDWPGLKRISDNLLETLKTWNRRVCIHLTGGEPLLKRELYPLLDYLDRQSLVEELALISNGHLVEDETLRRFSVFQKLKTLKISLDGGQARVHDSIRHPGSFQRAVRALSLIKEARRYQIIILFTVMKRNYRDLPGLLTFCEDSGMDGLILERFIPWGRGKEIREEVLDPDQWRELIQILSDSFSIPSDPDAFFPYQAFQVKFGEEPELLGAPCIVGFDGLCLMPGGEVFPCRRFPVSIGNLLERSLTEIWGQSELLKTLRQKKNLKGRCGRCPIQDCRGCRSLALSVTGDPLGEDPHCGYPFCKA